MHRQDIEDELKVLAKKEKRPWQRVTYLLLVCAEGKLYQPEFPKFTRWLRGFARDISLHEATFWRYYGVGSFYISKTGAPIDEILKVTFSPVKMNYIKQINEIDEAQADDLFHRLLKDDPSLTTPYLLDLWEKLSKGQTPMDTKVNEAERIAEKLKQDFDAASDLERKSLFLHILSAVTEKGARDILDRTIALKQVSAGP